MKRLPAMILAVAAAAFWWVPVAAALEADQVRGEIVEADADTLTLRVAESGDARPERVGEIESYEVTSDTVVRRSSVGRSIIGSTSVRVGDLFAGDEVILAFEEVAGRRVARDIPAEDGESAIADTDRTREQTEAAQFEADERGTGVGTRDRLPATASILPLLALTGFGFAGAALLIRVRRRR